MKASALGSVTSNPDYELNWSGGSFTIGARSGADITLIVNGPDGRWYCNDDWDGTDPAMTFSQGGTYDIWVGTFGGGTASSVLYFTEF